MRPLLLALLLFPATALAQETDPAHRAPNRTVLALVGVGASTATLMALGTASPDLAATGLLLAPVSAATAIHFVGRAQGGQDSFGRTLGSAAVGTLPALALLTATALVMIDSAWDPDAADSSDELGVIGYMAGVAFLAGPGVYAAMRYRTPVPGLALMRTPEGALVPVAGVAVRF